MAEFAINDAWQESVQETPFMLIYGQHPLNFLPCNIQEYAAGYCTCQELFRACSAKAENLC